MKAKSYSSTMLGDIVNFTEVPMVWKPEGVKISSSLEGKVAIPQRSITH